MSVCFRKAHPGEAEAVHTLTADRVVWMNENGIHQWNDTGYLAVYPPAYYRQHIDRLYVLADSVSDDILCAAMVFESDDRWDRDDPAFYIHNFVSARHSRGAGRLFLQELEVLARKEGIAFLRLDSADGNEKLAAYYTALGFQPCGTCRDGAYHGILRQKSCDFRPPPAPPNKL